MPALPLIPLTGAGLKLLAPTALQALGLTALTGAGTAGLTHSGTPWGQSVQENLGIDSKSVARDEVYDLSKGEIKDWDGGDKLRSFLTGVSRGDVTEAAETKALDDLSRISQTQRADIRKRAGELGLPEIAEGGLKYTPGSGQSQETYLQGLEDKGTKLALLEQLKAIPGASLTGLSLSSSNAAIQQLIEQEGIRHRGQTPGTAEHTAIQSGKRAEEAKIERGETRRDTNAWRKDQSDFRDFQFNENNKWRQYQSEKEERRLNADRQERALQRDQNLQLAIMGNEDKRADRRMAREDRLASQRQASIMAMIKGMTQLGAGMAI